MSVRILQGDVRDMLATLPDESVHCVVTSPPYWGLRDYGVPGQLGLEPTLGEHIDTMVGVFREVRRVLRKDGTLWLNYGDCYATAPNGRSAADTKATGNDDRTFRDKPFSTVGAIQVRSNGGEGQHHDRRGGVLKPKDLCMIPNRLAIALQDDGWWVRSEIVWHKPNPMPESAKDRPTCAHEKVWLLSKSARYFYDADSVKTPASENTHARRSTKKPYGWDTGPGAHGSIHRKGREKGARTDKQRGHGRRHAGFNERYFGKVAPNGSGIKNNESMDTALAVMPETANLRNVWTIATAPFPDAHFATFPPALAETCIKAGCVAGGTVLDPFIGSGTTAMVADRLGRDCIGIELNPEYAAMARRRVEQDAGMFAEVAAE